MAKSSIKDLVLERNSLLSRLNNIEQVLRKRNILRDIKLYNGIKVGTIDLTDEYLD